MKKTKGIFIHILPVLLGVAFTVFLSALLAVSMIDREREASFEQLDSVCSSLEDKIDTHFTNGLNMLERIADAISLRVDMQYQDAILDYIDSTQPSTMFERIDIMLADGTLLHQTGVFHRMQVPEMDFSGVVEMGSHYTERRTDHLTGRKVIYGVAPMSIEGEFRALLIGVVRCDKLPEKFSTYSFDGNANAFLIDRQDGALLMDNWHDQLGNISDYSTQDRLRGYEDVDVSGDIRTGTVGTVAFYSETNGMPTYMHYHPLESFPWMLAISVQEEHVFADVRATLRIVRWIAAIEMVLLVSYVVWNAFIARILIKQDESVQRMQLEAETNKAKSLFLSSMSHDIRTPLNGIIGMLAVIDRRRNVSEELREDLGKIRISAEYLMALADNVLDLNAMESGKVPMERIPMDLRELKAEIAVLIQSRLKQYDVTYSMEIKPMAHPCVLGSAGYLHRVLVNLIGNGLKYNKEKGSVWVTAEERTVQEGRSVYRFTVQDTGLGMSKEFQAKMFSAFEQERAGSRSSHQGHGLGLTIVDRMVRSMGGSIQVESTVGEGSTFVVEIPFDWDTSGAPEIPDPAPQEVPDIAGLCVLLVEDNELNLEIAQILLTEAGAQVTTAVNGREAVSAFAASEGGRFDLILMDVMMPVMDGLEATAAIRRMKHPDAARIPIIAMTANTFAEDIARCKEAGMNAHVGKPLDMEVMIATMARAVAAGR